MGLVEKQIVIRNRQGLHARPAAMFVQLANKYDSSVKLIKDGTAIDGKSIIAVLSLGASRNSTVTLLIEGEDAEEAFVVLKEFLEREND